jgi:EmrB/QacA subfamily drug resistance transporter
MSSPTSHRTATHVASADIPAQRSVQHGPPPDPEVRRPWTALVLVLLAQFMVVLDVSVVNIALPSIGSDLDFRSGDYQWAVSAYVLCSGGLLLLGGRLADLLDRRAVFLTGLSAFTLASLASGLADDASTLVVSRGVQGVGAALLTPAAMSIVMTTYTGRQRQLALSVWGAIASSGIAAGVLFGGLLTSAAGWRAVFFINVPIGLAVAALTSRTVPGGTRTLTSLRGLDLPGAVSLVTGLIVLVYAIEHTHTTGWTSGRTWTLLAVSAGLLTGFALVERRSIAPLVPPHAWRIRSLIGASAVMAGVTGAVVGAIFLTSLYLQRVLGSSAVESGLQFLPLAIVITASAGVASTQLGRTTPRAMIAIGLLVMAAGAVVLAATGGGSSYWADVLPGLLLIGAGVGPMFVAISVAAMSDVPGEQSGVASGLMMTGHEVGAALGVAALSTVVGDLTTRAGLVDGYSRAFTAVLVGTGVLLVVTLLALPRRHAPSGPVAPAH